MPAIPAAPVSSKSRLDGSGLGVDVVSIVSDPVGQIVAPIYAQLEVIHEILSNSKAGEDDTNVTLFHASWPRRALGPWTCRTMKPSAP